MNPLLASTCEILRGVATFLAQRLHKSSPENRSDLLFEEQSLADASYCCMGLASRVVEQIRRRIRLHEPGGGSSVDELERGELARTQQREAFDRDLIDLANVFLVGVDHRQRIGVLNRRARDFFGDDAIGKPALQVLDPATASEHQTTENQATENQTTENQTLARLVSTDPDTLSYRGHHVTTPDGTTLILDWQKQLAPVRSADLAVVLTGSDVTERARKEEALTEHERQLHEMCDALPVLVAYVGTDDRYRFNNKGYQRTLGLAPETLKGLHIRDVLDERAYAAGVPYREKVKTGEPVAFETQVYDREGYLRDAAVRYTPHFDNKGNVVGYFVTSLDVTEQKKLEKALRHSQKLDAIGRLASGSAHDFNNLMMGISGCANLALSKLSKSNAARPLVEEIRSASISGGSIARKLLNFSRDTSAESVGGEAITVVLDENIRQHQVMLEHLLSKNIELHLDLSAGDARVEMPEGHLEQILMNLVLNARDAMPEGGDIVLQTRSVQLDAIEAERLGGVEPGPYACLTITDTGMGMDADTAEQIFEPFFTTKEIGKGVGLGLSTVYGHVTRAGGTVEVQSSPGTGTTFTSWLPIGPRRPSRIGETPSRELPTPEPSSAATQTGPRQSVLLVEDDRLVRMTVRNYLVDAGFDVIDAESGTEAVERATEHHGPLDLLITDLMLPGITGVDVANRTRALHPLVKVLFISAHSREVLAHAGILGADDIDILQKPFSRQQLLRRVHQMVEHSLRQIH